MDETVQRYYEQSAVQERVLEVSEDREVIARYKDTIRRRPDVLDSEEKLDQWIRDGMTSVHGSVEKYLDPMLLDDYHPDKLRTGWDLVIDIDSHADGIAPAKMLTAAFTDILDEYDVSYGIKFSGSRGFHLCVPAEAFHGTVKSISLSDFYPALPQSVIRYLKYRAAEDLSDIVGDSFYQQVSVEENWGQRHLFRFPYSLHEATGLASVVIDNVVGFSPEQADPRRVKADMPFLSEVSEGEAYQLVRDALDYRRQEMQQEQKRRRQSGSREYERPTEPIDEDYFPEPIGAMLDGLEDGRKRATFVLITFLRQVGYDWDAVEDSMWAWNERNQPPLEASYLRTQLRWHERQPEDYMPPNYSERDYYDIVDADDASGYRNPVPSALARYQAH